MDNIFHQLPASSCASNVDSQSGNLFLLLLNALFASQCALKNPNLYPPDLGAKIQDGDHFDFIVVGAGSAGSVVASRLVETGKWRVLLVEAGDFPSITTEIPALLMNIQSTDESWKYYTKPSNTSCMGLKNGSCHWPRGKVLGGSSSMNGMLYLRGNKKDYDSWAGDGNEGWDYENVKHYFRRSENLLDKIMESSNTYGRHGPIPLTKYKLNDTVRDVLLKSAQELGYNILEEEGPLGFFESLQNIENGVRYNAAKILIDPSNKTNKLTLAVNAHVEKIIIDKEKKEAEGIRVKIGEKILNIFADQEVILSAGAINSPQILMLSGVGPEEHLRPAGIEVIQDLKVGQNLQDHLLMPMFSTLSDEAMEFTELLDDIHKYYLHREGSLSNVGLLNIMGFINTRNNSKYPNIQFHYLGFPKNKLMALDTYLKNLNIGEKMFENLMSYNKHNNILLTGITLLQPKSRGEITLKNTDPYSQPIISSGYLTDEKDEDLETVLKAVRIAEAQLNTDAFRKINAKVLDIGIPNCNDFKFDTDAYWRCAARNVGATVYHPTATCKMGPESDKSAVVGPRLKVHGVKNLRVMDASTMPTIISANTQAACMMIGQKGAQMIIEDHQEEHH